LNFSFVSPSASCTFVLIWGLIQTWLILGKMTKVKVGSEWGSAENPSLTGSRSEMTNLSQMIFCETGLKRMARNAGH